MSILFRRKPRHREAKKLTQHCLVRMWQSWDSNKADCCHQTTQYHLTHHAALPHGHYLGYKESRDPLAVCINKVTRVY